MRLKPKPTYITLFMQISFHFSERLILWQKKHGRHHLPWQVKNPYAVWLSEIMLQQTQVTTVLDYFPRFLSRFPSVQELASAKEDDVLALWAGLGYYSRARNLHKAAKQVVSEFNGQFPQHRQDLEKLCGVGRSTAAAIAAFSFNQRETILDGNVKRVLCRVFNQDGSPTDKKFEQSLWDLAEQLIPLQQNDMPSYIQGLMDLGSTVCKRTKPLCNVCPMHDICQAKAQDKISILPRKKSNIEIKTLPIYWLVIRDLKGAFLLEKRPPKGIWGGLYCVPCFEQLNDLYQYAANLGIAIEHLTEQISLTHRLTHRLLLITPFSISISNTPADKLWVEIEQIDNYGLPKPLLKLITQSQSTLF